MKKSCPTGDCRWMFKDVFKSWEENIGYFLSSAAVCGLGHPEPCEVFKHRVTRAGDHVPGGPELIQLFLAAVSQICHTPGQTEMGAGLAATAQGIRWGLAEICSSGGGPEPLSPRGQQCITLQLLAPAQGKANASF